MESKKGIGQVFNQILEGRGFYIVVALCAAIIGVSLWSLFRSPSPAVDEAEFDEVLSEVEPLPYDPVAPDLTPPEAVESADPAAAELEPAAETVAEQRTVWPLEGEISREFSMDHLQYDPTMADWRTHDGVDIAAEVGTKVSAIRSGTVQNVYVDDLLGSCVIIDHGEGLVVTYANLEQIPTVYTGDSVQAGDVIGSVGETAAAESAQESHLHLSAALNGASVSPMDYLQKIN